MGKAVRTGGRAALRGLPALALALAALTSPAYAGPGAGAAHSPGRESGVAYPSGDCDPDRSACRDGTKWLYRYSYTLGVHPFTRPDAVRGQLTDHFWMFPVSGSCPARIRRGDECDLLGGNPVRVESAAGDHLQIATLPGHDLGEGLHIRFTFTRTLGFHYLVVGAWQDRPTRCTEAVLCGAASRAGAWALWRVLAGTLTLSAYAA